MDRWMRKLIIFLVISILIFSWITPVEAITESDSESIKEIDIMTTPEEVLFDLQNLKPGDWSSRTIEVTNNGTEDINYIVSGYKKAGSDKFYKALEFTIRDVNGALFHGKLSNFNKFDLRELASGDSELLEFTVKVPEELGNDYQGLMTEVEFKFYAEGTLGGLLPADGPKLPATASGYFHLLVIGIFFIVGGILFHTIKNKFNLQ